MTLADTLSTVAKALKSAKASHALIGGFALAAHGVVRATQDIDLLVDGGAEVEVLRELSLAGFVVVNKTENVIQLSGAGQVDILWAKRDKTKAMLGNSKPFQGFPVPVVAAEDLIGLKIQAYCNDRSREFQDKADILALMKQVKSLDFKLIKEYAELFGEWKMIEDLKTRI